MFSTPDAVKHYLQLHLARRQHEIFAVLFLDSQNRLIGLEELFRGTLTQLSVTLLRKYFGWFRHFTATQSEKCRLWSRTLSCPLEPVACKLSRSIRECAERGTVLQRHLQGPGRLGLYSTRPSFV